MKMADLMELNCMKNLLVLMVFNLAFIAFTNCMEEDFSREELLYRRHSAPPDYLSQVRQILKNDNNMYVVEPANNLASLERELVMNEYWKSVETQSPEVKKNALEKILDLPIIVKTYPLLRYHIAAALYAGADPNAKKPNSYTALVRAVQFKDLALCQLLLQKGAKTDINGCLGRPLIFDVETKAIAELFLEKGANCDMLVAGQSLLHEVMSDRFGPNLVQLYRTKGISPFLANSLETTPLALLAILAGSSYYKRQSELSAKVAALLSGIDQEGIKALITPRIFDILSKDRNPNARFMELLLRSYLLPAPAEEKPALEKNEHQAIETCPICCDEPVNITTECNHKFCNACLTLWLANKNTCPLCRSGIVKP